MKRITAFIVCLTAILTLLTACAPKFTPSIKIDAGSVTSVDFKKTYFDEEDASSRTYKQKTVTEPSDVESLVDWLTHLHLTKHEAIEVPVEKVTYVLVLNGTKTHKVIFMDEYIIYDTTAYTFDKQKDLSAVADKYDLLGYSEEETELGIINS